MFGWRSTSCGVPARRRGGFTLIEMLVVVAIIALLLCILLPSLSATREQARRVACGAELRQISLAGLGYINEHRGWLPGSPNTSGNGARSGFGFENNNYAPTSDPNHYPAMHVFDWANPLQQQFCMRAPVDLKQRYASAVRDIPGCPSNRRRAGAGLFVYAPPDSLAPSYATSRFFMYVSSELQTGEVAGTLWWHEDCMPLGYLPRIDRIRRPEYKAFLADAHVVSKGDEEKEGGEIVNANYGFASQGAWRFDVADPGPVTYRGSRFRSHIWRHRGGINILGFDGHVQYEKEGEGRSRDNFGTGARQARWWFPSGTDTEKLPSRRVSDEPALIVP